MGNNLCKERIERAENSKSPVDRVIGRCAQVLPNRHKEKNTNWHKHVLETCPPLTNEPKCTNLGEWRSVTLRPVPNDADRSTTVDVTARSSTIPASHSSPNVTAPIGTLPVAPPRRKRGSTLQRTTQPGGFKDVFGHLQRRASVDSAFNISTAAATPVPPKRFNSSSNVSAANGGNGKPFGVNDPSASPPKRPQSGLVRKVSKVGNKKSDKFFGENLSDCLSDEHIDGAGVTSAASVERPADELDAFVQNNAVVVDAVLQKKSSPDEAASAQLSNADDNLKEDVLEPHSWSSLDRKAEFLMTMLENHSREEESRYHNRMPVEEPLIVPKRKQGRHICDDDEHMKRTFGAHEQHLAEAEIDALHSHANHEHAEEHRARVQRDVSNRSQIPDAIDIPTPKKPDRVFSKKITPPSVNTAGDDYSHLTAEIIVERPTRRKSSLSREKLPKPPPTPTKVVPQSPVLPISHQRHQSEPFHDGAATFRATSHLEKAGLNSSDDANPDDDSSSPPALLNDDKLDSILKKCNSSHSFLTPDLMDQIINKVYGFKMNWDGHDIRRSNSYDDGSTNVAPISKLKPRKISVIRNKEAMEKPIIEESAEVAIKPSFSIGGNLVTVSASEIEEQTPPKEINQTVETNTETNESNKKVDSLEQNNTSDAEAEATGAKELLEKNFKAFDDIVSAIAAENSDVGISDQHNQPPTAIKRTNTVIELQKNTDSTPPASDSVLDHIYTRKRSILDDLHLQLDEAKTSSESDENPEPKNNQHSTTLNPFHVDLAAKVGAGLDTERRGSIVDCDDWFNRHTEDLTAETPPRRDSNAVLPPYDTRKLFPFGRRDRSYSESSEFFEDTRSVSSSTEQLDGDEMMTKLRQMKVISPMATAVGNDHSTLLKYLDGDKEK